MVSRRSLFAILMCVGASTSVAAQRAEQRSDTVRIAVLGIGGAAPGDAARAAAQLEELLAARTAAHIRFTGAEAVERFMRDYAHVGWSNEMPLSDLGQVTQFLRADFLLVIRLSALDELVGAELQLLDSRAGTVTIPLWGRASGATVKAAVERLAAPADSLLRTHARLPVVPPAS